MKCPECGQELKNAAKCGNCGKDISLLRNGLEVEYKEFPVSELLEIRQRPHAGTHQKKQVSHEHATAHGSVNTRRTPYVQVKKALFYSFVILCGILIAILGILLFHDTP